MKKKWLCLFTALALIAGVCAAAPMSGEAVSLELDKKDCSMKIFPENPNKTEGAVKFGTDLDGADIVVDVYKVANASKISGYDSYNYAFLESFSGVEGASEVNAKQQSGDLKASDWQALAQAAAKKVLGDGSAQNPPQNVEKATTISSVKTTVGGLGSDLGTGLYLLIARSSTLKNPEDYRVVMKGESHTSTMDGSVATIANSNNHTYIFAPQLISLPMRNEDVDVRDDVPTSENGPLPDISGNNMTSDLGRWVYNVNVYLKPIRVRRYGSLEISKKLQVYESEEDVLLPEEGGSEPADGSIGQDEKTTFVFKATWDNPDYKEGSDAPRKISRVDSLTFPIIKENGEKVYDWQLYMDGIPVGTEVTVEEIYSGASYEIVGSKTQTVSIGKGTENIQNGIAVLDQNDAVIKIISQGTDDSDGKRTEVGASVAFTNTYSRNQRKGYGINNEFAYDDSGRPGWIWIKDGVIQKDENGNDYKIPVDTTTGGNTGGTPTPDNPGGGDSTNENNNNTENNNINVGGEVETP